MELLEGIGFIPAMVGLFGLSEVLKNVGDAKLLGKSSIPEFGRISLLRTLKIILRNKMTVLKASLLGTCVGALPGAGADIAAWVAYGMEKKTSKNPEEFGKGSIKGVIAPTSANNAALGGTWIPALVFGVPGDSITAIVLGAMLMYGLRPGPLIFQENLELVHGIFAVGLISQFLLIPVGLIGIRIFGKILRMPRNIVMVIVLIFSVIGSYAIRNSFFDIYIMAAFGVAGFFFEYLDIPLPPLILAIILGPMIEDNLRVGLIKTHGGFGEFIFDPICLTLIFLILFVFFGGSVMNSSGGTKGSSFSFPFMVCVHKSGNPKNRSAAQDSLRGIFFSISSLPCIIALSIAYAIMLKCLNEEDLAERNPSELFQKLTKKRSFRLT
jgi:TctA family transporter